MGCSETHRRLIRQRLRVISRRSRRRANDCIEKAYQLIRDLFVFTNKRLILVDKQDLTGHKVEYQSLPYKSIIHFSVETAGHFDLDAMLKI